MNKFFRLASYILDAGMVLLFFASFYSVFFVDPINAIAPEDRWIQKQLWLIMFMVCAGYVQISYKLARMGYEDLEGNFRNPKDEEG